MKRFITVAILALALGMTPALVHAGVTFQLGNHPQPDEVNVLLEAGQLSAVIHGTAGPVTVLFSSGNTTQPLTVPSNGQSRIEAAAADTVINIPTPTAVGGLIHDISIFVPGGTYNDLIFNTFNLGATPEDRKSTRLNSSH